MVRGRAKGAFAVVLAAAGFVMSADSGANAIYAASGLTFGILSGSDGGAVVTGSMTMGSSTAGASRASQPSQTGLPFINEGTYVALEIRGKTFNYTKPAAAFIEIASKSAQVTNAPLTIDDLKKALFAVNNVSVASDGTITVQQSGNAALVDGVKQSLASKLSKSQQ